MVRELMHDPIFLAGKSSPATAEDLEAANDLAQTLEAHRDSCVGMAANMIGVRRRIIAFYDEDKLCVMFNPTIIKRKGQYKTQEGCLSLLGGPREAIRYKEIRVEYQNERFQTRAKNFSGFVAQIIQHEVDHLDGILI